MEDLQRFRPRKSRGYFRRWLKPLVQATSEFIRENGVDKSSILAYYSIFSSFFLLIFFTWAAHFIPGGDASPYRNVYPFSPEFLSRIAPPFFEKVDVLSGRIGQFGILGMMSFLFFGVLVFKKIIQYINEMFHIRIRKGFLLKRLQEGGLLLVSTLLVITSVLLTGWISAVTTLFHQNQLLGTPISAALVEAVDTFLVRSVVPFSLTFFLFLILFKWIPERRVSLRPAALSAFLSALLWEVVKRGYTYYLIHFSLLAQMQGPILAIILFGFWMEISMGIMLFGAKLTYILDRRHHD